MLEMDIDLQITFDLQMMTHVKYVNLWYSVTTNYEFWYGNAQWFNEYELSRLKN